MTRHARGLACEEKPLDIMVVYVLNPWLLVTYVLPRIPRNPGKIPYPTIPCCNGNNYVPF